MRHTWFRVIPWVLVLLLLPLLAGPHPARADDVQDRLRVLATKSRDQQRDPIEQGFLQGLFLKGAMAYRNSLSGLACQKLFSLGDPARFRAALGNSDGSDHNLVFLEGKKAPRHLDGGPYIMPVDTADAYYPLGPSLNTYWHEVNHSLLDSAGLSASTSTYSSSMDDSADEDDHHPFIEGVGHRGVEAYEALEPFERAAIAASKAAEKAGTGLTAEREREIWAETAQLFVRFREKFARVADMPADVLARYRAATGVFFSPVEDVVDFYRGGGLVRPDGVAVRPPDWVFGEDRLREPVALKVTGSGGREVKGAWVAEREIQVRARVTMLVKRGTLTVALDEDERLVGLRLTQGPDNRPVEGIPVPGGRSTHRFQVDLAGKDPQPLRLTFSYGDLSQREDDRPYHVRLAYVDAGPKALYNTSEEVVAFQPPGPNLKVVIEGPARAKPGETVALKARVTGALPPGAKLEWTDVTRGRPLGAGETARVAVGDSGVHEVSVAVGKVRATHRVQVEEATPTPTPSPEPVTKAQIRGPKEVMISDDYEMEVLLPPDLQGKASTFVWEAISYSGGTRVESERARTSSPRLKQQQGWDDPTRWQVRILDGAGKWQATSESYGFQALRPQFSLTLYGQWEVLAQGQSDGRSFRMKHTVEVDEELREPEGHAKATGFLGGGFLTVRFMTDSEMRDTRDMTGPERIGDFVGNGTFFRKGKVGFAVDAKLESGYWINTGGPRGSALSEKLREKWEPVKESTNRAAGANLKATVASIRLMPVAQISHAPGVKGDETPPGAARVRLEAPRKTVTPGQSMEVRCVVEGATGPFTYTWSGDHEGKGERVRVVGSKPGPASLSVSVANASGSVGGASLDYQVGTLQVQLSKASPAGARVPVGAEMRLKATLTGGNPPGAVFRWQPHPEVTFDPFEGPGAETKAMLTRPGPTILSVAVVDPKTGTTLAESDPLEVEGVGPKLTLSFDPAEPLVGQDVKATVKVEPPSKAVDFRWQVGAGGALVREEGQTLVFRAKAEGPVEVVAAARVPGQGDSLGEARGTVKARPYTVRLTRTGEGGVPAGETVAVQATVDPAPPGKVEYRWTISPGARVDGSGSAARVSRSDPGPCEVVLEVQDPDGLKLGRATLAVPVVESAQKSRAATLVKEARALLAAGKVDEAAAKVREAAKLDPKAAAAVMAEVGAAAKKLGMNEQSYRKHEEAVRHLEIAVEFLPQDGDAKKRLETARKAMADRARIEPLVVQAEGLLAQHKLWTARVILLQAEGIENSTPGAQSPRMKAAWDLFHETNRQYGEAVKGWEATNSRCFDALDWEGLLAACADLRQGWELLETTESSVKGSEKLARERLAEQKAAWAEVERIQADFAAGRLAQTWREAGLVRGHATRFGPADPRRQACYDLVALLEKTTSTGSTTPTTTAATPDKPPTTTGATPALAVFVDPNMHTSHPGEQFQTTAYVQGGAPPYRYDWSADGERAGVATSSHTWTLNRTGTFEIVVKVTDSKGKVAQASCVVEVALDDRAAPLQVRVDPSSHGCAPGSQFQTVGQATGGVGPYRFEWFIGNERTGVVNQAHVWTLNNPGEYQVRVVATDSRGTAAEATARVVVAAAGGTTPPTAPPTSTGVRVGGKGTAGTVYEPNTKGDVFQGGTWCNARNGSDFVQLEFDGIYDVSEIRIGSASTDVTTEGARILMRLQSPSGAWIPVEDLRNTNINRTQLTGGGKARSIPPYRKTLSPPVRARLFRLDLSGHGWFGATDIQVIGRRVGAGTSTASTPPKPPPTPPSTPPAGATVVGIFENRSGQNIHLFPQGGSFDPSNRVTPGQKMQVRLSLPRNGRITFVAGRDGRVLATRRWDGDPDDPRRYPHVVWDGQRLTVSTGLR